MRLKPVVVLLVTVAMVASTTAFLLHTFFTSSRVAIQMNSSHGGNVQVFWRKASQQFSENRSQALPIAASKSPKEVIFELPSAWHSELRIDPINVASDVLISQVRVENGLFEETYTGGQVKDALYPLYQIENARSNDNGLSFHSSGNDPQFGLLVAHAVKDLRFGPMALQIGLLVVSILLIRKNYRSGLPQFSRLRLHQFIICSLLLGFFLSVGFKLHNSSLHAWYRHYPHLFFDKEKPLLGEARAVRSDEWLVHTPGIVSQAKRPLAFKVENPSYGDGSSALLMGLPVSHLTTFFRPQYWGFFLFDVERGFSWMWSYRCFACLLGFYLLLYLCTAGRPLIALVGSLWFYFSAFTQWWLSSGVPEMVGSFGLAFFFFFRLLTSQRKSLLPFAALGLCLFSSSFALQVYPPFQVPLFWLGITLVCMVLSSRVYRRRALQMSRLRAAYFAAVVFAVMFALLSFYSTVRASAELLANTAYPGQRVESGGGFSFSRLASGFGSAVYSEENFPETFGNVSEGSSFLLLWPLAALLMLPGAGLRPISRVLPLVLYLCALSTYVMFGWPQWLSDFTLFRMVPSNRAMLTLGAANIIFVVMALARFHRLTLPMRLLGIVSVVAFVGWVELSLEEYYGTFFDLPEHSITLTFLLILGISLVLQSLREFGLVVVGYCAASSFLINPVTQGLHPLLDNRVSAAVQALPEKVRNSRWMVYGDFILPSLFKASGLNVFSGVNYVPRLEDWKKIDADGKFLPVYNRYAHFQFQPAPDPESLSMRLEQADLATVIISPCSAGLEQIGIDVFVLPKHWASSGDACLKHVESDLDAQGLSIFVRKSFAGS